MRWARGLPRLLWALGLGLLSSCATSRGSGFETSERPAVVRATPVGEEQFRLDFEPLPPDVTLEALQVEEVRQLLADFFQAFPEVAQFEVVPALASPGGSPAAWERRLRAEFLARYGPGHLPLPASLQHSPLVMALKMSTRYMGPGVRDAAREMFRSPVFLASVALSVLVYFSAWALPEPIFSKAFAATLTVRLAMVVGLLELRHVALACLQFYRDAQAAKTLKELEAVAERFGRALGGTALRVLVTVASFGVARALPNVPPGGMGPLLGSPRYAMAGGMSFQSAGTAHVVADGTIVIAGAAVGSAASALGSACGDGSQKKDGYQWHHLATDKNEVSPVRGGPWTPYFEQIFARAGMSLNAPENRVYLKGHQGPHPEEYHEEVYDRLLAAVRDCKTAAHCKRKLVEALQELAEKACTPGARINQLLTVKSYD
ncbi:MAG TPA: AHH domain-containing protein [Myxococcaceae bacterium]|nr:AHH domain-containing protein [Myxococcaceae bacterium]